MFQKKGVGTRRLNISRGFAARDGSAVKSDSTILYPGGALPNMGYIGMCRCEGYGFQAVYSRIGYINQSVWV